MALPMKRIQPNRQLCAFGNLSMYVWSGYRIDPYSLRHFKIAFEDMSRHWRGRREKEEASSTRNK